jgi:hypothetical protein
VNSVGALVGATGRRPEGGTTRAGDHRSPLQMNSPTISFYAWESSPQDTLSAFIGALKGLFSYPPNVVRFSHDSLTLRLRKTCYNAAGLL